MRAGGRAFFDWLADLPWQRLGVWGIVVVFAYQLRDFFGVRKTLKAPRQVPSPDLGWLCLHSAYSYPLDWDPGLHA